MPESLSKNQRAYVEINPRDTINQRMQPFEQPSPHEEAILAQAYERALSGRGQEQIDMEHFVEDYGAESVAQDKARVAELEAKFEAWTTPEIQEALRLGTILEAIVTEQAELNEWLGSDVRTRGIPLRRCGERRGHYRRD